MLEYPLLYLFHKLSLRLNQRGEFHHRIWWGEGRWSLILILNHTLLGAKCLPDIYPIVIYCLEDCILNYTFAGCTMKLINDATFDSSIFVPYWFFMIKDHHRNHVLGEQCSWIIIYWLDCQYKPSKSVSYLTSLTSLTKGTSIFIFAPINLSEIRIGIICTDISTTPVTR